ncbi:UvrB/UvrC motif-containing protein [Candidatus Berkelbacteria bacterium]|nr:UvrB/UvrC motif-containing protein [Candidatus Berkelbacteria bacterium]MBI4029591.1 UvrB/UvrC motif-containing protein [Candidatus Berkelbacteria bacterium]
MYWANFLHIYQPPTQTADILDKVVNESYRKILAELKKRPKAKLTLNISGGLTELLAKHRYFDVLADIKKLLERDQLELTQTAKYHAFLPCLPTAEVGRQIELNQIINRKYFGKKYRPRGFFIPEMAYTLKLARLLKKLGYQWIIIDDSSFPPQKGMVNYQTIYELESCSNFYVFFRERGTSFKIISAQTGTAKVLFNEIKERLPRHEYLLTAMDGETFGHHRLGLEQLLTEVFASDILPTVVISDLFSLFKERVRVNPISGSWALFNIDEARRAPFSRWYNRDNKIHRLQWELTNLALKVVDSVNLQKKKVFKARKLLDSALHSDQYWWASAKPWWSIEIIERGASKLLETIKQTPGVPSFKIGKAEDLYKTILFTAFEWQRDGTVDKLVKEHIDEEAQFRIQDKETKIPRQEIFKMINHLKKQMYQAAKAEEYERAAVFKERINNLAAQKNLFSKNKNNLESHWGD